MLASLRRAVGRNPVLEIGILFDGFVGLFIALTAVPVIPISIIAGFLLFRLFDVVKSWPIAWFDRYVHGGLGIMLDDALAGLFARIVPFSFPHFGLI
ncbi:MAG: phosphatidylglycerophosphatase A [Methylococcaceae bacterium]|nr:phosphatidylglycerophosphatase A [Methylococcaceae bacterium]